jgi:hypothetical protein
MPLRDILGVRSVQVVPLALPPSMVTLPDFKGEKQKGAHLCWAAGVVMAAPYVIGRKLDQCEIVKQVTKCSWDCVMTAPPACDYSVLFTDILAWLSAVHGMPAATAATQFGPGDIRREIATEKVPVAVDFFVGNGRHVEIISGFVETHPPLARVIDPVDLSEHSYDVRYLKFVGRVYTLDRKREVRQDVAGIPRSTRAGNGDRLGATSRRPGSGECGD